MLKLEVCFRSIQKGKDGLIEFGVDLMNVLS